MKEEFINKNVDAALNSLDKMERASPRPFLFTRLEARMQNERNIWSKVSAFVARPVVAFACMCFVLVINAMVIFISNNSGGALSQPGSELATADEYSQVSSTIYEFENAKP
jgi:hypothetical protein